MKLNIYTTKFFFFFLVINKQNNKIFIQYLLFSECFTSIKFSWLINNNNLVLNCEIYKTKNIILKKIIKRNNIML